MASKFADELFNKWLGQGYGEGGFTKLVDAELAEVREVLDGLRSPVRPDYDPMCWCVFPSNAFKTAQHEAKCQRARALYEKLRTDK